MAPWLTPAQARERWRDAPADAELIDVIGAAQEQCEAYLAGMGIVQKDGEEIPSRYRQAVMMQVRGNWNAGNSSPVQDAYGGGDDVVRIYPMSATIRRLLVPQRGGFGLG